MNIKEFCKKHKKELIITGCIIGGVTVLILTKGRSKTVNRKLMDVTGLNIISWGPSGCFSDLETAKKLLEANADNNSLYAIVKEGNIGKNIYSLVILNDSAVVRV